MQKPNDVDEFIARQRAAIAANPDCGTSHYNLAIALMGKQQYEEAKNELHQAIDCSPGLAEAYVQLGAICLRNDDLDGCLAYNQRAVKARPGFSEGWGNIGFVHMQKGDLDEAIKALKRATAFNFRFIQALTTLGNAYLMKGMVDESIETNLKALKVEAEFPVAHNNLAIAYLEKKDFKKAVFHCDKARQLGYEVAPQIINEIEAMGNDVKGAS